ncbi:PA2169 family four-helix-bundle protein [uncultured Hyphomonas sp.]|uniref:PA2169 family four-helix-bundle protein n=1 Tax=uncultured Hyphomonas sp. TaxID=225298 RepID=UPI002AAABC38|nr:PA2169 family four-helix-bundle protein [uncultured Hyphomonas sp.]
MNYRHIAAVSAIALATSLGACANAGINEAQEFAVDTAPQQTEIQKTDTAALNKLIPDYIDAAALYKRAADIPDKDRELKPILIKLAQERQADRERMQNLVVAMGGEPAELGEAVGTGHRTFTELRTLVADDSEVAVEEVLRGERYLEEQISSVLAGDVSDATAGMLEDMREDTRTKITLLEKIDDAV